MNTITKTIVLMSMCLVVSTIKAQDSIQKPNNSSKIETLQDLKEAIKNEERAYLKTEVEAINQRLDKGEITNEQAENLKKEAAKKRALNIENRIAIIDNKIELLKRNGDDFEDHINDKSQDVIRLGTNDEVDNLFYIGKKNKIKKYDRRTTNAFVWAFGLNNVITDGQSIGDSYNVLGSGFVELGWSWKTRVFKESNAMRIKYGFSFQWNKLNPKDNQYFVQNGNITTLETFPSELRKSEFRMTNLVFPVYFEFGPSKKIEKENYFRYSTTNQFKFGIGGYAGFNIGTQQKLKYKEDGDRVKQKIRKDYNTSDFVYGLGAYIGFGSTSLYAKYDVSPIFKDQLVDQNNISL
ncbi:MAG: hypothetical protein KDC68_06920, partial [Gelidibacter sp.]|nr:hypothetical protein [Gelidibacter sp.]